MIINLNHDWRIRSDEQQWVVQKRSEKATADRHEWRALSYFKRLDDAVVWCGRRKVMGLPGSMARMRFPRFSAPWTPSSQTAEVPQGGPRVWVSKGMTEPRVLRAEEAAQYVNAKSVEAFRREVRSGLWPRPFKRDRWDKAALDHTLDTMSGLEHHGPYAEVLDRRLGLNG